MILTSEQLSLTTRCLWALQEAVPEIEGLLLTNISGLTITATLTNTERTQRLAALSAALFLLGEHATEAWGRGQAMDVRLRVNLFDDGHIRHISLKPITEKAVLMATYVVNEHASLVSANIELAVNYLEAIFSGASALPSLRWYNNS